MNAIKIQAFKDMNSTCKEVNLTLGAAKHKRIAHDAENILEMEKKQVAENVKNAKLLDR
jgi:hypothetical protein